MAAAFELVREPGQLPALLAAVLGAEPGSRAAAPQVRALLAYVFREGVSWQAAVLHGEQPPRAAALLIELPGRTGLFLVPAFSRDSDRWAVGRQAIVELIRDTPQIYYYQALLEPGDLLRAGFLTDVGFSPLTQLLYLERATVFPWVDEPRETDAEWLPLSRSQETRFATVIARTYEDSLDCPELCPLRPLSDTLASHRGSGTFDPTLWELCVQRGVDQGCILLAAVPGDPGALEVVYVGGAAESRGRGVGHLLLARALTLARQRRFERLTLAVDARNSPARALYDRFAFRFIAARDAWLYVPARGEVAR